METCHFLAIEFPISGFWGTAEEMALRDDIAFTLEAAFQQRGFGFFDGRETGLGSTAIHFREIPDDRWGVAVELTLAELRQRGILENASVVRRSVLLKEPEPEVIETVFWPRTANGEGGRAELGAAADRGRDDGSSGREDSPRGPGG